MTTDACDIMVTTTFLRSHSHYFAATPGKWTPPKSGRSRPAQMGRLPSVNIRFQSVILMGRVITMDWFFEAFVPARPTR
jgi:hypothetical protein